MRWSSRVAGRKMVGFMPRKVTWFPYAPRIGGIGAIDPLPNFDRNSVYHLAFRPGQWLLDLPNPLNVPSCFNIQGFNRITRNLLEGSTV